MGAVTAIVVFVTAISGLLLAHSDSIDPRAERPLPVTGSGSIEQAMPINDLLIASLQAVADWPLPILTPEGDLRRARGPAAIERALFRPTSGTVQVLLRDPLPVELVLDWRTSQMLSASPRHARRWAGLHSWAVAGERGTLLSDALAGSLVLMSLTGIWIWFRDRRRADLDRANRLHRRAGLVAGIVLLVPSVTGVLMTHRADLGFTFHSDRDYDAERLVKLTPAPLPALVDAAVKGLAGHTPDATAADVDWLDYHPSRAHAIVGFKDGTDVFVDVYTGDIRSVMPPRDTWVRQLHSGRVFGAAAWVITDLMALLWIAVTGGGLYLAMRSRSGGGVPS